MTIAFYLFWVSNFININVIILTLVLFTWFCSNKVSIRTHGYYFMMFFVDSIFNRIYKLTQTPNETTVDNCHFGITNACFVYVYVISFCHSTIRCKMIDAVSYEMWVELNIETGWRRWRRHFFIHKTE